jgi:hypothetical protein
VCRPSDLEIYPLSEIDDSTSPNSSTVASRSQTPAHEHSSVSFSDELAEAEFFDFGIVRQNSGMSYSNGKSRHRKCKS